MPRRRRITTTIKLLLGPLSVACGQKWYKWNKKRLRTKFVPNQTKNVHNAKGTKNVSEQILFLIEQIMFAMKIVSN